LSENATKKSQAKQRQKNFNFKNKKNKSVQKNDKKTWLAKKDKPKKNKIIKKSRLAKTKTNYKKVIV